MMMTMMRTYLHLRSLLGTRTTDKTMQFATGKKPQIPVPKSKPFSEQFLTTTASKSLYSFSRRKFNGMKILPLNKPATVGAQTVLDKSGFLPTVREITAYLEDIVREFYTNLGSIERRKSTKNPVFVRGYMYEFTPRIINQMFQLPNPPFGPDEDVLRVDESPLRYCCSNVCKYCSQLGIS
ncbi:unnamed protein product [Microthlaspi erraticum]|uniref:Uncharacterized protein n=1 Tax=Microthlaspi erraticum TaxID=1685480 RepID=A0A6D2IM09_9BRAS|nr:unnamed protein product [Microthlaspi erraticum]